MKINVGKTKIMHIRNKNNILPTQIILNNAIIESVSSAKFLSDLKWNL